ncbi:MAG: VWA domain-containing protein [Bryobacterales bacterium]|nr:VWA domain-containing protein [Bryobacterales bacterium]
MPGILSKAIAILLCLCAALAANGQWPTFRSDAPLVVAHTTVKDAKGAYAWGLEAEHFQLLVDGKPVPFDLDHAYVPISLVLVVENCGECGAAIKKLRKVGSMIEPLITGERGEVALLTYAGEVREQQPFLRGADGISESMAKLRPAGRGAVLYDSLSLAVSLLEHRLRGRRGVILHIGERIDRGSKHSFEEVANRIEQHNILLYSVTYSRFASAFTDREAWKDRTPDSEFYDKPADGVLRTPPPDAPFGHAGPPPANSPGAAVMGNGAAPSPGPLSGPSPSGGADLGALFQILGDAAKKNAARELARLTGGDEASFNKQKSLENAIARIGEELHSQYVLSFRPPETEPGRYYRLEVKVSKPDAREVRSRPGYWMPGTP